MDNGEPGRSELTFVHLTDCHIVGDTDAPVYGVRTDRCLAAVVDRINGLRPRPRFAVFGGDLVSPDLGPEPGASARMQSVSDYERAYRRFRQLVEPLAMPRYYVVGNHDHRSALRQVVLDAAADSSPCDYAFNSEGYHFIVLDTQDPGQVPGVLDEAQLAWLRDVLTREGAGALTMLILHHPPVPIGIPWLDVLGLKDSGRLFSTLQEFPNVRWVLCGHVHHEAETEHSRLKIFTTPSTCFQFGEADGRKRVEPGPPAFRLLTLRGEGLMTQVVRVAA